VHVSEISGLSSRINDGKVTSKLFSVKPGLMDGLAIQWGLSAGGHNAFVGHIRITEKERQHRSYDGKFSRWGFIGRRY
jgi:hypothetical protein